MTEKSEVQLKEEVAKPKWNQLLNTAILLVTSFLDSDMAPEQKKALTKDMLTPLLVQTFEQLDDLVLVFPFGAALKMLVDNPLVNAEQEKLVNWIVDVTIEHAYGIVKRRVRNEKDVVVDYQRSVLTAE